jgi:hypothetical protein
VKAKQGEYVGYPALLFVRVDTREAKKAAFDSRQYAREENGAFKRAREVSAERFDQGGDHRGEKDDLHNALKIHCCRSVLWSCCFPEPVTLAQAWT